MSLDELKAKFLGTQIKDLDNFLFLLENTDNTLILKRFFDEFLNHVHDKKADAIAIFYSTLLPKNRYVFLTLIREHYQYSYGDVSDDLKEMSHLPNALVAFDKTNAAMETKTKWQSRGMMLGGVTFGMEVVMLGLERVAWSDTIEEPGIILALIAAGFMIFGYPMGRFFKSAHHEALLKQNKENYFEAQYGEDKDKSSLVLFSQRMQNRSGYAIAAFGVLAEGLLIFRGILSGIGFTADLLTLCATGDDYQNKLPGTYFMDTCPEAGYILCPMATLFAASVSYCLMSGHFALDGRECCDYEAKKRHFVTK